MSFFTALPQQADENEPPYPAIRNQSNAANESYGKNPHIRFFKLTSVRSYMNGIRLYLGSKSGSQHLF